MPGAPAGYSSHSNSASDILLVPVALREGLLDDETGLGRAISWRAPFWNCHYSGPTTCSRVQVAFGRDLPFARRRARRRASVPPLRADVAPRRRRAAAAATAVHAAAGSLTCRSCTLRATGDPAFSNHCGCGGECTATQQSTLPRQNGSARAPPRIACKAPTRPDGPPRGRGRKLAAVRH